MDGTGDRSVAIDYPVPSRRCVPYARRRSVGAISSNSGAVFAFSNDENNSKKKNKKHRPIAGRNDKGGQKPLRTIIITVHVYTLGLRNAVPECVPSVTKQYSGHRDEFGINHNNINNDINNIDDINDTDDIDDNNNGSLTCVCICVGLPPLCKCSFVLPFRRPPRRPPRPSTSSSVAQRRRETR